jgi:predicted metal-dependent peptidase
MSDQTDLPELNMAQLERELDRTKTQVFLGSSAAFLGPLMCSMDFVWDDTQPTAWTDGTQIGWNPYWFLKLPPKTRLTVLTHELWHPAFMHMVRIGERDPKVWNWAGDIVINNGLEDEGYSFETVENCWKDQAFKGWNTEAVYEALMAQQVPPPPCGPFGAGGDDGDIKLDGAKQQQAINNVLQAAHAAQLAGQPGAVPGHIQEIIKNFLKPKVKWDVELNRFMTELLNQYYSWRRPRRRTLSHGIYLPSRIDDKERLQHLTWYFDVSGSVSNAMIRRFVSEVHFVWNKFKPKAMTLVMFDTFIRKVLEFKEGDKFEEIKVLGRGGTSFIPVRDHIMETKPNAAIIFSDMICTPMTPGPECPVLWVAISNKAAKVKVGKLIHVNP